jgi:hypothetical protein
MTEKHVTFDPARCYFKFGDDFQSCLEKAESIPKAFELLAEDLEDGAKIYRRLASLLKDKEVSGGGGTHSVFISMPESLAKNLVKQNLGIIIP